MRPADLIRHSSFRLALMFTLFIVTTLVLAGGVGFGLMHAQLTSRQDARVMEMFRSLELAMTAGDQRDLVEAVTSRIAASPDLASIYLLKDRAGHVLASNLHGIDPKVGWSTVAADIAGVTTNYPYRVFTGTSGTYTLSVGLTDADLDDLREIMAGALGWSALVALIVALGIGAILAARMDKRLAAVDQTMNRVAHGDLTARLALSGRGDDLDHIATMINGALARLEGVVEAMRQVSADIAHDLRTPLNRLRIRIEAAATKAGAGQSNTDDLGAALTEADQISETFSALLRIAQIEAGSRKSKFQTLDLAALLRNVTDVYREVAEDEGQVLTVAPLGPARINGDAELLTQMFANLIENAIRHCPVGTAITCELAETGGQVCVTVADTGPGIPEAERENVLRRLYRLEKSRTSPGSGLGLSLVRAIADLHEAPLTLGDTDVAKRTGLKVQIRFPAVVLA
jgi:signal transduction histidine kinase